MKGRYVAILGIWAEVIFDTVRSLLYRIPLRYAIRYPLQRGSCYLDTRYDARYMVQDAAYVGRYSRTQ